MIEFRRDFTMNNVNYTFRTHNEVRNGRIVKVSEAIRKNDVESRQMELNNRSTYSPAANDSMVIPIWEKVALTIEEAAKYSNISSKTLRRFINECTPDFTLKIGTKTLIKRKVFEKFLERTDANKKM